MWRQYRKIEPNELCIIAIDTAQGGGDYTAMQVLSATKLDVPIVYHSQLATGEFLPTLHRFLNALSDIAGVKPIVAIERNNGGLLHSDRLNGLNLQQKYTLFKMPNTGVVQVQIEGGSRYGWDTNAQTRPNMVADIRIAIQQQLIKIYDPMTYGEMLSFIVKNGKPQAERNAHDDLIMSLAICWQIYQMSPKKELTFSHQQESVSIHDKEENEILDKYGFY